MWYDFVDNTYLLERLYLNLTDLSGVQMINLSVSVIERRIDCTIIILKKPDWIPAKWKNINGNSVKATISLWGISNLSTNINFKVSNCDISFSHLEKGDKTYVNIVGAVETSFCAEAIRISQVDYIFVNKST